MEIKKLSNRKMFNSKKGKVLYGYKNETLQSKVREFLRFSPEERYIQMVELAGFVDKIRKYEINLDDWKPFKNIQILKPKQG